MTPSERKVYVSSIEELSKINKEPSYNITDEQEFNKYPEIAEVKKCLSDEEIRIFELKAEGLKEKEIFELIKKDQACNIESKATIGVKVHRARKRIHKIFKNKEQKLDRLPIQRIAFQDTYIS